MKKILLASDHAGFALKEEIQKYLVDRDYKVEDLGPFFYEATDDYPDYIRPLAEKISKNQDQLGFIFGGSGQGEAMVANRTPGVRCAVFYGPQNALTDIDISGNKGVNAFSIVELERIHNNANVLSFGARFVTTRDAQMAVDIFLETVYKKEDRHERRINKIDHK